MLFICNVSIATDVNDLCMFRALWKACAHRPLLAGARGLVEQQVHQMSSLMTGVTGLGSCRSPVPATLVPRAFAQSLHHAGGAAGLSVLLCTPPLQQKSA